jgi:hypothetical protein
MTKFVAFRDLVRGMSLADRTLLALACCHENRDATRGSPAEYEWNKAKSAIEAAEQSSAKDGD